MDCPSACDGLAKVAEQPAFLAKLSAFLEESTSAGRPAVPWRLLAIPKRRCCSDHTQSKCLPSWWALVHSRSCGAGATKNPQWAICASFVFLVVDAIIVRAI